MTDGLVASGHSQSIDWLKCGTMIALSMLIVITTIHAQDFKDELGDQQMNRRTFNIAYPPYSRLAMPVALTFWSCVVPLALASRGGYMSKIVLLGLGIITGLRYFLLRTCEEDQVSYYWYNVRTFSSSASDEERTYEFSTRLGCVASTSSRCLLHFRDPRPNIIN